MIPGNEQKENCYVMAETIFAGKQVKEFLLKQRVAIFAFICTKVSRFLKYFFVCHRPGNTGNWKCK